MADNEGQIIDAQCQDKNPPRSRIILNNDQYVIVGL